MSKSCFPFVSVGGVKRPAEGSREEPSEKKNLPVVAKTFVPQAGENRSPSTHLVGQTSTKVLGAAVQVMAPQKFQNLTVSPASLKSEKRKKNSLLCSKSTTEEEGKQEIQEVIVSPAKVKWISTEAAISEMSENKVNSDSTAAL